MLPFVLPPPLVLLDSEIFVLLFQISVHPLHLSNILLPQAVRLTEVPAPGLSPWKNYTTIKATSQGQSLKQARDQVSWRVPGTQHSDRVVACRPWETVLSAGHLCVLPFFSPLKFTPGFDAIVIFQWRMPMLRLRVFRMPPPTKITMQRRPVVYQCCELLTTANS